MKKINEICENPYNVSERLVGPLKDKRKTRVGKYRIIFIVCEECRKEQFETFTKKPCKFCAYVEDKTVVFFNARKRSASYR